MEGPGYSGQGWKQGFLHIAMALWHTMNQSLRYSESILSSKMSTWGIGKRGKSKTAEHVETNVKEASWSCE